MNNSFSLQQTSKTGNLDSDLISREYKLNLMAKFMQIKFENPKLKQSKIADQLGYSSGTLQRYRNDINMLSPYRIIQPNITKKRTKKTSITHFDKNPYGKHDLKGPQLISNDLVKPELNVKSYKENKSTLKAGSVHGNIEITINILMKFIKIITPKWN